MKKLLIICLTLFIVNGVIAQEVVTETTTETEKLLENLAAKGNDALEYSAQLMKDGVALAESEIPLIIKEFLVIKGVKYSLYGIVLPLLFPLFFIYIIRNQHDPSLIYEDGSLKHGGLRLFGKVVDMDEANVGVPVMFLLITLTASIISFLTYIGDLLTIIFAPRIFIIEYFM